MTFGPCCASDIEPALYRNYVWESHIHLQIYVFEDFYHQKK